MSNILKDFQTIITDKRKKPICYSIMALAVLFCIIGFFSNALAVGLFLLLFLSIATTFIMLRAGLKDTIIHITFLTALLIHLWAVLFIYYGHFRPFGGGADFEGYNQIAIEIANRFSHGNFSLQGLYTDHFFPILIGILYMFTLSNIIVGQLFTVWLAAVSVLLAYLIVLEIGGTKKIAFLMSIIVSIYPSYLYFGSILLKDTIVVPFTLAGIFLILKMVKNFSWGKFLLFFTLLTFLINLRFYVGYALMFSLIFSWPVLSVLYFKKKMIYWLVIIFFLGFSPQILGNGYAGNGYYGFDSFQKLLNPQKITYYREVLYSNNNLPQNSKPTKPQLTTPQPTTPQPITPQPITSEQKPQDKEVDGNGSTFVLETGFSGGIFSFLKNSFQSFLYSLLGPFPWQFKNQRQIVGLIETVPWYLLIVVSFYGCVRFIRKNGVAEFLKFHRFGLPLLLFGILALGALSLYINNYGIIARIRIPVFICFTLMMFLTFNSDVENYYKKIHEKISNNRRVWIHWFSLIRGAFKSAK